MEIKYTKDGKKVRVVGTLNATETIVQEIFCDSSGAEIPSGENFVVKSLHDAPVKSWKQKEIENWDASYDKRRESYRRELRLLDDQIKKTRRTVKASGQLEKYFDIDKLENLDLFMSGAITHYMEDRHGEPRIFNFNSADCNCTSSNMRLLTLYGRSDGDLQWRLSTYSDHSGGGYDVEPCLSYEDALQKAQACIDKYMSKQGHVTANIKKSAEKYGLHIPAEYLERYKAKQAEYLTTQIEGAVDRVKKLKKELKVFNKGG